MKRKHLIKSAEFWFEVSRDVAKKPADRLFALEQAYNHVENAVAWLFEKSSPEVKAKFLEIQNTK